LKDLQKKHPIIGYIDNMGIYTGVELVRDRKTKEPAVEETVFVREHSVKNGLMFEKGGYYHNRLQCIPSLNITKEVLDKILEKFDKIFSDTEKKFSIK